jgi:hypothetical protein
MLTSTPAEPPNILQGFHPHPGIPFHAPPQTRRNQETQRRPCRGEGAQRRSNLQTTSTLTTQRHAEAGTPVVYFAREIERSKTGRRPICILNIYTRRTSPGHNTTPTTLQHFLGISHAFDHTHGVYK